MLYLNLDYASNKYVNLSTNLKNYNMKSKIPLVLFIIIMVPSLHTNYAFKKKVKAVCSSYRVDVQSSQFLLEPNQFTISLESGRNNFEMFMLVGFASAGQAISHQKTDEFIKFIYSLSNHC